MDTFPQNPRCQASSDVSNTAYDGRTLCKACGICCSGLLYSQVKINAVEADRLIPLDLQINKAHPEALPHPCGAYNGHCCNIYLDRPKVCREYQCKLLKEVISSDTQLNDALEIVDITKQQGLWIRNALNKIENPNAIPTNEWPLKDINIRDSLSRFAKSIRKKLNSPTHTPLSENEINLCYSAFDYFKGLKHSFRTSSLFYTYADLLLEIEKQANETLKSDSR